MILSSHIGCARTDRERFCHAVKIGMGLPSMPQKPKVVPKGNSFGRFTASKEWAPDLLQDFHRDALSQFHARRSQDSADGIGHAPLAADHSPEIAGVDAQLKHGELFAFDRTDLNLVGIIASALAIASSNSFIVRLSDQG